MAQGKFISYLRVSTKQQGISGLGLEAQRASIESYLNGGKWELLAEFVEVESGKRADRPELHRALKHCKLTGSTLVIARLDRLARNAHFLLGLQNAGVKFVAADMPDANEMTVGIMAVIAQGEAKAISQRTKAALAAAKERGVKLGSPGNLTNEARAKGQPRAIEAASKQADQFAENMREIMEELTSRGLSLRGIASELTGRGVETPRGGAWTAAAVSNLIKRLN